VYSILHTRPLARRRVGRVKMEGGSSEVEGGSSEKEGGSSVLMHNARMI
jgi:hypothetical protein